MKSFNEFLREEPEEEIFEGVLDEALLDGETLAKLRELWDNMRLLVTAMIQKSESGGASNAIDSTVEELGFLFKSFSKEALNKNRVELDGDGELSDISDRKLVNLYNLTMAILEDLLKEPLPTSVVKILKKIEKVLSQKGERAVQSLTK